MTTQRDASVITLKIEVKAYRASNFSLAQRARSSSNLCLRRDSSRCAARVSKLGACDSVRLRAATFFFSFVRLLQSERTARDRVASGPSTDGLRLMVSNSYLPIGACDPERAGLL